MRILWAGPLLILPDVITHAILLLHVGFFWTIYPEMSIQDPALVYIDSLDINKPQTYGVIFLLDLLYLGKNDEAQLKELGV